MADRIEVIIDGSSYGLVAAANQGKAALRSVGDETRFQSRGTAAFNSVLAKQGENLRAVGRLGRYAGTGLAIGLGVAVADTIRKGVAFESEMARVQGVLQATGDEANRLGDLALQMGAKTKFSAGEAASAEYELASAGFKVKEMGDVLPGTLSLAAASNIDLSAAAEISSNALRGFGLDGRASAHVADVLAQTVNSTSTEMSDLQLTMKYIGPIAKATGQSFETMLASVGLMGDAGIKGEQAGTTLRAALLRLTNPIGQTKDGLAQLGLEAEDLQGPNGLLPLPKIIKLINQRMQGWDQSQRNAALSALFGQEAASGMFEVFEAGAPKLRNLSRELENSDGAAKRAAHTMNDTVAGAWDRFRGSVETTEIALYQRFEEPLKDALVDASKLVNTEGKNLEEFFDGLADNAAFENADLGDKLRIALDELRDSNVGDELKKAVGDVDLGDAIADGLDIAIPVVADAAWEVGSHAFVGFTRGFVSSDFLGKLALGTLLIRRMGLTPVLWQRAGASAAAAAASGAAAGAAANTGAQAVTQGAGSMFGRKEPPVVTPESKSKVSGVLSGIGRAAGPLLGVNLALGVAAGFTSKAPTLEGKIQDSMSSITLGLVPSFAEESEAAVARMQSVFENGLPEAFGEIKDESWVTDMVGGLGDLESPAELLGDFSTPFTDAYAAASGYRRRLEDLRDQGEITGEQFAAMAGQLDTAWKAYNRGSAAVDKYDDRIRKLEVTTGRSLDGILRSTQKNVDGINRELGPGTKPGVKALGDNYNAAMVAIRKAMDRGIIATDEGNRAIRRILAKQLDAYGTSINDFIGKSTTQVDRPGGTRAASGVRTNARGGSVTTVPGRGREDSVGLFANGSLSAVVAPGEDLVVLNSYQRPMVDRALMHEYGTNLPGLFNLENRKHMAGGGIVSVPGLAGGGVAEPPGDPGSEVVQAGYENAVGAFLSRFGMDLTQGYNPGGPSVSPGHLSLSAAPSLDVVPKDGNWDGSFAQGLKWALSQGMQVGYDGQYGTQSWPDHGEGNHAHIDWKGGGEALKGAIAGAMGAAMKVDIKLPRFDSDFPAGGVGASALNIIAEAAEKKAERFVMQQGGGMGMNFDPGQGALSEAEARAVIQQAMQIVGVPKGIQPAVLAHFLERSFEESGWNPDAVNNWDSNAAAGDPSQGFLQTIMSTFNAYKLKGYDNVRNPLDNTIAALRYALSRYGSGNWSSMLANIPPPGTGYARGGIVELLARGGQVSGDGTAEQRRPETSIEGMGRLLVGRPGSDERLISRADLRIDRERNQLGSLEALQRKLGRRLEDSEAALQKFLEGAKLSKEDEERVQGISERLRELKKDRRKLGGRKAVEAGHEIDRLSDRRDLISISALKNREDREEARRTMRRISNLEDREAKAKRSVPRYEAELDSAKVVRQQLREALGERSAAGDATKVLNAALGPVFRDFEADLDLPYLGAFMQGTAGRRIGRSGVAVVHRDEVIHPDPEGPAYTQRRGAGGVETLRIELVEQEGALMRAVDIRLGERQPEIVRRVDRSIGRRGRQLAHAPGGR